MQTNEENAKLLPDRGLRTGTVQLIWLHYNGEVIYYKLLLNPNQSNKRCQRIMKEPGTEVELPKLDRRLLHMHIWSHAPSHNRPLAALTVDTQLNLREDILGTNLHFKVEVYFLSFLTEAWSGRAHARSVGCRTVERCRIHLHIIWYKCVSMPYIMPQHIYACVPINHGACSDEMSIRASADAYAGINHSWNASIMHVRYDNRCANNIVCSTHTEQFYKNNFRICLIASEEAGTLGAMNFAIHSFSQLINT